MWGENERCGHVNAVSCTADVGRNIDGRKSKSFLQMQQTLPRIEYCTNEYDLCRAHVYTQYTTVYIHAGLVHDKSVNFSDALSCCGRIPPSDPSPPAIGHPRTNDPITARRVDWILWPHGRSRPLQCVYIIMCT